VNPCSVELMSSLCLSTNAHTDLNSVASSVGEMGSQAHSREAPGEMCPMSSCDSKENAGINT
jgi:hypothetical protein